MVRRPFCDVSSVSRFSADDPASVVPKEWGLPASPLGWGSHRRGNAPAYQDDFVPLFAQALMPVGNRVFFVLNAGHDEAAFFNYTGMTLAEAAALVGQRRIIPQLLSDPAGYPDRFDPIFRALDEHGLETFHVNTYETLLLRHRLGEGPSVTFQGWKASVRLPDRQFAAAEDAAYTQERGADGRRRTLMPPLTGLKGWVEERIAWQTLEVGLAEAEGRAAEAARLNIGHLETLWASASPVKVFSEGLLVQYTAAQKYYAKRGVLWFAGDEDRQSATAVESLAAAFGNTRRLDRQDPDEPQTPSHRLDVLLPRFLGKPSSLAQQEGRERYFRAAGGFVGSGEPDRALRHLRDLEAGLSPPQSQDWGEDAQRAILQHWNHAVQQHAEGESVVRTMRVRLTQLALNVQAIAAIASYLQRHAVDEPTETEDLRSFFYLGRDLARLGEDFRDGTEMRLQALRGRVVLSSPKAGQLGAVLDTRKLPWEPAGAAAQAKP